MAIQYTKTYLNVAATTIENRRPELIDQISDTNPVLHMARKVNAMPLSGGDQILAPLMYAFNSNVDSYSRFDELPMTPPEVFSVARYDWKDIGGTMPIAQDDIDRNRSESATANLIESLMTNLALSVNDRMNTMLHGDGTGNNSKDTEGLRSLVNAFATNTVGGISRTSYPWWRNVSYAYITSTSGYGAARGGTLNSGTVRNAMGVTDDDYDTTFVNAIDYVYDEVTFNESGPNIAICSFPCYRRLKQAERELKRYGTRDMTVEPGFTHVNFNGVPVAPDAGMPSLLVGSGTYTNAFYWLNLDFMKFWVHEAVNFITTDFYPMRPRQNAWAANFFLKANWAVQRSSAQGVLHTISA